MSDLNTQAAFEREFKNAAESAVALALVWERYDASAGWGAALILAAVQYRDSVLATEAAASAWAACEKAAMQAKRLPENVSELQPTLPPLPARPRIAKVRSRMELRKN
jgi:hypothetical protein